MIDKLKNKLQNSKFAKLLTISIAVVSISSCASYPETKTVMSDGKPGITFVGGKRSSKIYVDKLEMGKVKQYRSKHNNALRLEEGSHLVEIVHKRKGIYRRQSKARR